MREINYNFSDVIIGFACPLEMEKQIIEESKRLYDTKSGVIRRARRWSPKTGQCVKL